MYLKLIDHLITYLMILYSTHSIKAIYHFVSERLSF